MFWHILLFFNLLKNILSGRFHNLLGALGGAVSCRLSGGTLSNCKIFLAAFRINRYRHFRLEQSAVKSARFPIMGHLPLKNAKVDHLERHHFYEICSEPRDLLVIFRTH